MKTITKSINSNINEVSTFSKATLAYAYDTGELKRVYTQKKTTYEVNNPMFPMVINDIKTLKEAFDINIRLDQMRTRVILAVAAWGYGWENKEPAVLLYNEKNYVLLYGEDGTKEECFSSKEAAERWMKHSIGGEFDYHRQLTLNKKHSTNKKVLTVRDWLLCW